MTGIVKKFTIRIDAELLGRIRAAYFADLRAAIYVGLGRSSFRANRSNEATSCHAFRPLETGALPTGPILSLIHI